MKKSSLAAKQSESQLGRDSGFFAPQRITELVGLVRTVYPDWQGFSHSGFMKDEIEYKRALSRKALYFLSRDALQGLLDTTAVQISQARPIG